MPQHLGLSVIDAQGRQNDQAKNTAKAEFSDGNQDSAKAKQAHHAKHTQPPFWFARSFAVHGIQAKNARKHTDFLLKSDLFRDEKYYLSDFGY